MTFAVLNPGGKDRDQTFPQGASDPAHPGHPPINYHAYAACCRGGFFRNLSSVPPQAKSVLVLLRRRNLRAALKAVQTLRARDCKVYISCKESGAHQVAELLNDVTRLELFQDICSAANGAISSTPDLIPLYRAAGCASTNFLPTPYPLEFAAWNFEQPLEKRRGIFLGTREFSVPSRNHLAALVLADEMSRSLDCPLAVINTEGRRGGMILKSLKKKNPLLYLIEGPLPYPDYLRIMALHRIVWQLDASVVPGQVAGDALLCRMPCLGGNGAIDRIAFPELSPPAPTADLAMRARDLLIDDALWKTTVAKAQAIGNESLAFTPVSHRLSAL